MTRQCCDIETDLNKMCNLTKQCRHTAAKNKVMQNGQEVDPIKPNMNDIHKSDLKHGESKG